MTKGEYSIMQAKGDFKTSFFVNGLVISLIKTKCLCIFKLDLFKYEFAEILLYYTNIKNIIIKMCLQKWKCVNSYNPTKNSWTSEVVFMFAY